MSRNNYKRNNDGGDIGLTRFRCCWDFSNNWFVPFRFHCLRSLWRSILQQRQARFLITLNIQTVQFLTFHYFPSFFIACLGCYNSYSVNFIICDFILSTFVCRLGLYMNINSLIVSLMLICLYSLLLWRPKFLVFIIKNRWMNVRGWPNFELSCLLVIMDFIIGLPCFNFFFNCVLYGNWILPWIWITCMIWYY